MTIATAEPQSGARIAITGANRGIGRALADALADAGAHLVVHARDPAAAALLADSVGARALGRVVAVAGDLREPELGARLADAAQSAFGGLDLLFLNAGMLGPMEALADTDFAAFREVMEVNVDAQLRLFVAALPLLRASRGKVVWMTSGLGHFALPRFGAYCASKHAVEGLARLAACEHAADGIVSVAVAPGMVRTEMLDAAMLGAPTDGFTAPAEAARSFVRLLAALGPADNGRVLDVTDFAAPSP